jgi:hypothetical protein
MGGSIQLSDEKKLKNYWLEKKKEKEKSSSKKDEDLRIQFQIMPKAFFYPKI